MTRAELLKGAFDNGRDQESTKHEDKSAGQVQGRVEDRADRAVELSEEVLQSVEDGQRAAIEAVHKFVDSVDRVLPALPQGEGSSKRQEIIDSALEMSDRLVHTQYDFIRKVVDSAGKSLSAK